jgi:pimeloyl-ACP methyl ester carboxylesterase
MPNLYKFKAVQSILLVCFLVFEAFFCAVATAAPLEVMAPKSEYVTVGRKQIYIEQYGKGRPLVMLHGGLGNIQSSFENQLLSFSKHYHVIAIEQVGHGHTPDDNLPFSYEQMAKDTVGVLRSLKVKDADIVGWSDGGILGLIIACNYPKLVHRLVISGANTELVGMKPDDINKMQELSAEELAKDTSPAEQEAYGKISPDGPEHWPVVVKKVRDMWLTPVILKKEDLSKIVSPVLVICGDNDIIPIEHTIEIYKSLRKAELLVLPHTGHHTFNDAQETLNPIILAFLEAP